MISPEQYLLEQKLLTLFTVEWWVDACMTSNKNPPESAGFFLGTSVFWEQAINWVDIY
jgi:hypothetical protein